MGPTPAKVGRIIVVLEDSHWTTTDPWSNESRALCRIRTMHWTWNQRKEFMKINAGEEYNKILVNHWRWLEAQGPSYKHQAASCKRQALSLTRRLYGVIGESRRKKL